MFKLIKNINHAFEEANTFIAGSMPDSNVSDKAIAQTFPFTFPNLTDWFVNTRWDGRPVLDSHVCLKAIAKYLVYPKTNKLNSTSWYIIQNEEDIPDIVHASVIFNKKDSIVRTNGFYTLIAEVKKDELFLVNAKTSFSKGIRSEIHVSLVSLALAKRLVYYKKDRLKLQNLTKAVLGKEFKFKITYD